LNSGVTPATDYYVVIDGRSYMGRAKGSYAKGAASDFDGVFEKQGANPLYKSVIEAIGENNKEVGRRNNEVWACLKRLRTPADVPAVEAEIGNIYTECGLTQKQYIDSNYDAAENFIKHDLVKGAKSCIRRLDDEMGYPLVVVSAGFKPSLDRICGYLGIPEERVYGTTIGFYGDNVRPRLMLGERKPEAKGDAMERMVGVRNGCCIVIDDNPSEVEHPFIKAGLNPSIITGEYKREMLPFDVTAPCPEAREDLTKLIPLIYSYEYGWAAVHTTDVQTEREIIRTASEINELRVSLESAAARSAIVPKAARLLLLKDDRGLLRDADDARATLGRMLVSEGDESVALANKVLKYLDAHVPEMRAKADLMNFQS